MYRAAGDLGFIAGPLALGAVADTGAFTSGFVITGLIMLAAAAVLSFVGETRREPVTDPVS